MAKQIAAVLGTGQTHYRAKRQDVSMAGLLREAVDRALVDARCTWDDIDAIVVAASTFDSPRLACGLFAAAVQQRIVRPDDLSDSLARVSRTRHRAALASAVADIAQGADALSEIDLVRLCRRFGLPAPIQQAVRKERGGRRRYLDASWRRRDGRLVVVEVDGALHLSARRWWDDQLRQNEITLGDALVLRFPSVIVRTQPGVVAAQLRRALLL